MFSYLHNTYIFSCFNWVILIILVIFKQNKDNDLVLNNLKLIFTCCINFIINETLESTNIQELLI